MFTAVTIEDANGVQVSLFDGQRRLGEVHGLHGLPSPRRIVRTRPGAHGEINETRHYAARQPVWNGTLIGTDEASLWAEYDDILRALWGAVSEPRLMRWTRGDGVLLQSYVKIGEAFDPIIRATDAGRFLAYQLVLDREDPRNYSQTLSSVTGAVLTDSGGGWVFPATFPIIFTPGGSGEVVVANSGTVDTPAILTIVGRVANPQILQVETGKLIVISGEVASGSTLVVNGADRTVLLDGVTDRSNLVNFAATDWGAVMIPPGGCTYRLLATSWDATAKLNPVVSRDAYA
jgi:hypothetical protein